MDWYKALGHDELSDGRVKPVTCGRQTVCMTHFEGRYAALDNACPHQGGPLGEGSIEHGLLRCPWHGWDFDPITGRAPGGFDDAVRTFPVEVRDDGVYVGIEPPPDHVQTVSDVMVGTMTAWGIRHVFGMVGHSNLGLADALRRAEESDELAYYGIRHEGAAAFAASAYGKLTGRPAACLAIAGPGATNLITGLWDANVDRSPVVALTGQVDTQFLGRGAFQEIDQRAAFGQVAQFSATVLPDSDHAELMTLACKKAIYHHGVSHLVFPDGVQTVEVPDASAGSPEGRVTSLEIAPPSAALEAAIARLEQARRPVIIVGHGARYAMEGVIRLAERLGAPVLTTFKAKGQIPDSHPLGCGVLGRSGTPIASYFMNESDVLVVLGSSFSNHTGIAKKKSIIQVDFEPAALGRRHPVEVGVLGEIGVTCELIAEGLGDTEAEDRRDEIAHRWEIWRDEKARRRHEYRGTGLDSASIFAALSAAVPDDAIVTVDVGNNTYSFGRYFETTAQAVLMSGYLGSIGFALPAAMGAWAATTEKDSPFEGRKVISISGDGGLGQYLAELTTAVKYSMDITHVVLNNDELGKISKEQRAGQWPVWQTGLVNPNLAEFAVLCGAHGARVTAQGDLETALMTAIDHDGPSLVELIADPDLL